MRTFCLLLCLTLRIYSQEFVVGDLVGQLGNQMFIIAATESLARDNGAVAVFPKLKNCQEWGIQENAKRIFYRLNSQDPKKKIKYSYREPSFHWNPIEYKKNMKVCGYFQSEKYFKHHKKEIVELFSPSSEIKTYIRNKFGKLLEHPKTVSIHFRDYLREDPQQRYHPNCNREYYLKAINRFDKDSLFIVFSNNQALCKSVLRDIPRNIIFIKDEPYYIDFYLMSMCKSHIISNSSFSWWASYLNCRDDKVVIAPKVWFNPSYISDTHDLLPDDWLVLD